MEHSQESKDEIEKAVIEERSKPLPRVEAQKWAKSHPDTTCKICKEHNLPCAPLESRVHCNTPACRNSDKACSKYDDELFKRIVGRFPSLQRSAFDEILSRLPPLSLSDLNPALVAARTSSAPEPSPNKSTVSFKQKTPPTNPAPDSASEAAQLPPNFNPHAFYVGYSVSSTEPTLDPNLQSSFFDPSQVQVLAQKITDLLEENGALKAKLEEANSAEAVLNDSNQNLEKVKADTETMIQGLREALERTEAEHKAADMRTREATILKEGLEKALKAELEASKEQIETIQKQLEVARQQLTKKDDDQKKLRNEIRRLREENVASGESLSLANEYKRRNKVQCRQLEQLKSERVAGQQKDMAEYFIITGHQDQLAKAIEYEPRSESSMRLIATVKIHLKALDGMAERRFAGGKTRRCFGGIMDMLGGEHMVKEEDNDGDRSMMNEEDEFNDEAVARLPGPTPSKRPRIK